MLLSPHNATALSDADYWRREVEKGFEIEAVMVLPAASGINRQSKQMWPWAWDGQDAQLPTIDGASKVDAPVYRLRVRGSPDFELTHEAFQPDGDTEHLPVSVRRAIGLVRLGATTATTGTFASFKVLPSIGSFSTAAFVPGWVSASRQAM